MKNTTLTDVHLGEAYYNLLIELAHQRQGQVITYLDLVRWAKERHPADAVVDNAIPISIGRRLDVVQQFCEQHQLPDLACLAVGQDGVPGDRYKHKGEEWERERQRVSDFDWSSVQLQWKAYAGESRKKSLPAMKRSVEEAERALREHWKAASVADPRYPKSIDNKPKRQSLNC